ncbi:hypothetical protein AQUCO_01400461v1 [Aquilegia coerulea]|uniref:WRKY domain-containing protein n=1 Tax=Aquilegia coerulea TaxID=218851 RepID=A0A2G5DWH4_AQUCA|nr:hypothetical protein AQUCO_01400461v1 [Aquilegia coerulea]
MSGYSSLPTNMPEQYSNLNHGYTYLMDHLDISDMDFEVSDFLVPEAGGTSEEDSTTTHIEYEPSNPVLPEQFDESVGHDGSGDKRRPNNIKPKSAKKTKMDVGQFRVAFRTKSELEIMDDGYKWRKYGKKSVKNSPNPRNYYRCNHVGCQVKKRVEREREDSSYVITTYDGVHTHESPSIVYYNEMPLMVPNGWTLQASQSSCS